MVRFLSDRNIHVFKDPVPQVEWTKEKMNHAMCFFPLVGAVQGCLLGLWLVIAAQFDLSVGIRFLWASAIPFLVTGGYPYGWLYGYYGCSPFLWRQDEKTGNIKRSSFRGFRSDLCGCIFIIIYRSMYEFAKMTGKSHILSSIVFVQ